MSHIPQWISQTCLLAFLSIASFGQTATFIGLDTLTQGNWKGKYGTDGYSLAANGTSHPSYVVPGVTGDTHIWSPSTTEIRGLQKTTGTDRIAATWYGYPSFSIDLNFTDQNSHQVAIYCLDWDNWGPRRQTIEILDASIWFGILRGTSRFGPLLSIPTQSSEESFLMAEQLKHQLSVLLLWTPPRKGIGRASTGLTATAWQQMGL
ncbi:MAG: hypothetical protein NTW74_11365 [Acidobacteria bacterium]|nr:hypothetical protein [Acidobacteriota bacterium]